MGRRIRIGISETSRGHKHNLLFEPMLEATQPLTGD